jgi:cobalt-zinc-cadmium efflux system outer membrane protein
VRKTLGAGLLAGTALLGQGCRAAGGSGDAEATVAADVERRTGATLAARGDAQASAALALLERPLSEEDAVRLALLHNASVREGYERLGVARAELIQAGLLSNPVFTASAKLFSSGTEVELGLLRSFVDLFLRPLRRRVAAQDLAATEAEVVRDLVRLVYDVRRAFVVVHGAGEVVRLRREALATMSSASDLMRRLEEAGNVRDADLTVEEVAAARARLDLDAAEVALRDAREALHVLLGLPRGTTAWSLRGRLPPLGTAADAPDAEERALASSLDLLEAKARLRAALGGVRLARREGWLSPLEAGAVGKREGDGAWGFGPEVTTAIPVFDTGLARALAASARARERLARHERLTVEVASAARRLADRAKALREREAYARETYLPLRARLVEETMRTFNAMQVGAFDVLDAKEGEADARREHAETLLLAWLARLDLAELLAGSLRPDRLERLEFPERAERPTPPKGH